MSASHRPPAVPGYRVARFMRAGSMGSIWEARDRQNRRIALKVADQSQSLDHDRVVKHYRREAAAVLHLEHDNLVHGYEVGETEDGLPFIALEYVEGETLTEKTRRAPLTESEAVDVGIGLARALEYMHARNLVHRDVKPDNVMLTPKGGLKLVDLGLAERANLEAPGCGSPGYASPEMMGRGRVGPASDLFALGITLVNTILGRPIFPGETKKEMLRNTLRIEVKLPEAIGERTFSENFRGVVEKLCEKSVRKRYGSAAEARLDLEAVRDGDRPFGVLLAHARRGKRPQVALGIAAVAIIGVGAWLVGRGDGAADPAPVDSSNTDSDTPEGPARDVQTEAAILFAHRNPKAIEQARKMFAAVRDRSMPPEQRQQLAESEQTVEARREQQAQALLAARTKTAAAHRTKGDLHKMGTALTEWPELLQGTLAHTEALELAATWRRVSLTPFETLAREAQQAIDAWKPNAPPPVAVVRPIQRRIHEAQKSPTLPLELRPTFATLATALADWIMRASANAQQEETEKALQAALNAKKGPARRAALTRLANDSESADTAIAKQAMVVLDLAHQTEASHRARLDRVGSRPWASMIDGSMHVGTKPRGLTTYRVLVPGFTVWNETRSWDVDDHDANVGATPDGVAAWRWTSGRVPATHAKEALAPIATLLALGGQTLAVRPDAKPNEFWRTLRLRLSMALRPFKGPAPSLADDAPAFLKAWAAAANGERGKPMSGAARAALDTARSAFLNDDLLRAWEYVQQAVQEAPFEAEPALLSSMVLDALSHPLRLRPVQWVALSEARRAWDLDPSLAPAAMETVQQALRIYKVAEPRLRDRLDAITFAAAERITRLRQDDAEIAVFLAEYYARTKAFDVALKHARKAHARWPKKEELLLAYARIEHTHGNRIQGVQALRVAKQRMSERFPAWAQVLLDKQGN